MSKIEKMANEATAYIPENEVMDMDGCAYTTIDEVAKTWYMLGAVAVLEEIEKVLKPEDRGLLYNAIKAKIKELKQ